MIPANPTTADYLVNILTHELSMANDRVNIYNQKFTIPNDQYMFIGVEYKFSKVFGSRSEAGTVESNFSEKQGVNAQEHYSIILFSRNTDAFKRKEEVVMALGSVYARQQGDRYGFMIARIFPIQDLSGLEGAAILYKFEVSIVVLARYEKIKTIDWYGTFNGSVTAEDGRDVTEDFTAEQPV